MNDAGNNPELTAARQQADERLIHALLLHTHDAQAALDREQRVTQVVQAIRAPVGPVRASGPSAIRARFHTWALWGTWAAAALVVIALGYLVLTASQTPALASLNDILGALARPGDRALHIQVEPLVAELPPRHGLNGATLYLRNGREYLLVRRDPNGGELFDGYDGHQSWRIRAGVVVETKEGLGAGGLALPQVMSGVLFVDLPQALERIRVDYTVERLDQIPLPAGGALWRHVLARRHSHAVKGPETIEIWAHPTTGMPRRIVFDQGKFQGSTQPRRLTFDLVSEEAQPANWFGPGPHAAADSSR